MVALLTLEKRRSSCGGELPGDRPSADWEQRHRCSLLLLLASPVLLTAGVLTEEGGETDDASGELSRGQHWRAAAAAIAAAATAAASSQ